MSIHVFREEGKVVIWSDCEPGHYRSGRCIGIARTFAGAKVQAQVELRNDLAEVEALSARDVIRGAGVSDES